MNCFACNEGTMKLGTGVVARDFKGRSYSIKVEGEVCSHCGYTIIEGSDVPMVMRRIADLYREAEGLLTSTEILSRRSSLNMNQQEFADYLRVGVASVKRWENGQVQESSMDELIRLKTNAGNSLGPASETLFSLDGMQLYFAISPSFDNPPTSMNVDLSGIECTNESDPMLLAA